MELVEQYKVLAERVELPNLLPLQPYRRGFDREKSAYSEITGSSSDKKPNISIILIFVDSHREF